MSAPRILVIDDDSPNQDFIHMALTDEGYEVAVANNGLDGLELVKIFRPDLILLDMWMPEVDGEMFLELYKEATGRKVPVIAFSASRGIDARALQLGADAFIAKPFSLDELLDTIHKHIHSTVG